MGEKEINKKHKVWAVVCGAVRQEFELYSILSYLCEYHSKGYIEGIVLSTWVGEVDNIKNLREKLKFLDVRLVEIWPLSETIGQYAGLNYIRQAIQLLNGLRNVPKDVFVLKCRTDFCLDRIKSFRKVIENPELLKLDPHGTFDNDLLYKIAVSEFAISHSFTLVDTVFFGYKLDIRKMLYFNFTQLTMQNNLWPDSLFFMSPFFQRFKFLEEFIYHFNYWILGKSLQALWKSDDTEKRKNFFLPEALNKYYAIVLIIYYTGFYIVSESPKNIPSKINFEDLFFKSDNTIVKNGWRTFTQSSEYIEKIVKGQAGFTKGYQKFYEEILRLSSNEYLKSLDLTYQDLQETAEWGKKYFGLKPDQWIKFMPNIRAKRSTIDFNSAIKIFFSEYLSPQDNDQLYKLANQVILQGSNYYNNINQNLDEAREFNSGLYEIMITTASRVYNYKAWKQLALLLLQNKISPKNIASAEYVFFRYIFRENFYSLQSPDLAEKLTVVYYWGKYMGTKDNKYPQTLYERFSQLLKLKGAKVIPKDYMDGMLDLANQKIKEDENNPESAVLIKKLKDFLHEIEQSNTEGEWL